MGVGFLALVVAGALLTDPVVPDRARLAASATAGQHRFAQITSNANFNAGLGEGVRVAGGSVTMATPRGRLGYDGKSWAWSRWSSWFVQPGQTFTQVVPTWNVTTPPNTLVQVQARVRSTTGTFSGWKLMGSWTTRDDAFRRRSGAAQADSVAAVSTDTLVARPGVTLDGYQLRVLLLRSPSSSASPTVRSLQAVVSRPASTLPATSRRLLAAKTLNVPRYSQMTHRGQYPQYGGGGQAWCSPTSLSMVLGYYRALPSAANYSWVDKRYADPWVDHVARVVYDYGYKGAGNWAFNTAYAANLTTDAFVTRLTDLRDAERFVAAGIPLIASISFSSGQLTGAPISATAGHLVVISGFTSTGDVVVNDPAAPTNSSVRRTYDRGQFERAWLRKSSGTVYVVRDAVHALPTRAAGTYNW
ncbi:MAG: hypothetical protein JWP24_2969 [Marmoricola sp.]|nr:hypothetical protein [Marmoricola sp.]